MGRCPSPALHSTGKCPNPALHSTGKMPKSCSAQHRENYQILPCTAQGKCPNPALHSTEKMPKFCPAQHRENAQILSHKAQQKCTSPALHSTAEMPKSCPAQIAQGKCPNPALHSTVRVRTAVLAVPAPHTAQARLIQHTHHINSGLICILPEKSKQHSVQSEVRAEPILTHGETTSPSSPLGHHHSSS